MARQPHPGLAGATGDVAGNGGNAGVGGGGFDADDAVDPAALAGGTGSGGDSGPDDYARNPDGSVRRNKDGSPRRKRGRKAGGSGGRAGVSDLKQSVDALTSMLGVVHMGIATATNSPEMLLSEDEAKQLAMAAVPVLDQFDWTPDPRFAAVFGFVVVAGKIYVPRAVAIRERRRREKPAPRRATPAAPAPQPMAGTDNVFDLGAMTPGTFETPPGSGGQ